MHRPLKNGGRIFSSAFHRFHHNTRRAVGATPYVPHHLLKTALSLA
jgi:hypothetical protein